MEEETKKLIEALNFLIFIQKLRALDQLAEDLF